MANLSSITLQALETLNQVRLPISGGFYHGQPLGDLLKDALQFDPLSVWTGSADPSVAGVPGSKVGDLYLRNAPGVDGGELWVRVGDAVTAWSLVNTVAGMGLATNHIFVGSAGGIATDVGMSGEASIVASGAITLANAAVMGKVLPAGYLKSAGVVAIGDSLEVALEKLDGNVGATELVANAALPIASFTSPAVTGKLLTGLTPAVGTVAAGDSVLQGFNKVAGDLVIATNTLHVDNKRAADYTETGSVTFPFRTIQAALNAVVAPSITNRYLIEISPGAHYSDPITIDGGYVTLRGCGVAGTRISGKITIANSASPTPVQNTFVGLRLSGGLDCFASHIAINVVDCNVTTTAWVLNPTVPTDDEWLQVWGGMWSANATITNAYVYLMGGGYYSTWTVTNKEFNVNNADINDPFTAILSGTLVGSAFGNRTGNSKFTLNAGVDLHMDADTEGGSVITLAGGVLTRSTKAISIVNVPAGGIAATDVQAAINELDSEKVSGPATATDHAIARFDLTTGKLIQDSPLMLLEDAGSFVSQVVDGGAAVGFNLKTSNALVTDGSRVLSLKNNAVEYFNIRRGADFFADPENTLFEFNDDAGNNWLQIAPSALGYLGMHLAEHIPFYLWTTNDYSFGAGYREVSLWMSPETVAPLEAGQILLSSKLGSTHNAGLELRVPVAGEAFAKLNAKGTGQDNSLQLTSVDGQTVIGMPNTRAFWTINNTAVLALGKDGRLGGKSGTTKWGLLSSPADTSAAMAYELDTSVALTNAVSKLLVLKNATVTKFQVFYDGSIRAGGLATFKMKSEAPDDGSIGFEFSTGNTFTGAGARILSLKNLNTEKFGADKDGYAYVQGTKVLSAQQAAVADSTGAGDVVAQLNLALAALRAHGLIAT